MAKTPEWQNCSFTAPDHLTDSYPPGLLRDSGEPFLPAHLLVASLLASRTKGYGELRNARSGLPNFEAMRRALYAAYSWTEHLPRKEVRGTLTIIVVDLIAATYVDKQRSSAFGLDVIMSAKRALARSGKNVFGPLNQVALDKLKQNTGVAMPDATESLANQCAFQVGGDQIAFVTLGATDNAGPLDKPLDSLEADFPMQFATEALRQITQSQLQAITDESDRHLGARWGSVAVRIRDLVSGPSGAPSSRYIDKPALLEAGSRITEMYGMSDRECVSGKGFQSNGKSSDSNEERSNEETETPLLAGVALGTDGGAFPLIGELNIALQRSASRQALAERTSGLT